MIYAFFFPHIVFCLYYLSCHYFCIDFSFVPIPTSLISFASPLPGNVNHFWNMVFQHKVPIIVMVTQLEEGGKNKCERYFPLEGKKLKFGDITVTWLSQEQREYYILSKFQVRRIG